MFRRTTQRMSSLSSFTGVEIDPYTAKSMFLFGFIASVGFLSVYSVKETKKAGPIELPEELQAQRQRHNDPRRPPWPLLHQRVVLLREGKGAPEDIALMWEQTKHYYPADWLIPLELTQVLKYSSGRYLQTYVADPDEMRKEVLMQLLNVKYGRVSDPNGGRVNKDVEEIISMAIDSLENMDLNPAADTVLVPTHT
ncbi:MIX protein, putative [Leishmania panamensis]|uniref:MIX protein, putative n=2 Tax=Leishmania guyanensis species complex TaxID=38579 RepID=A0A088RJ22_LEIPA|nr:MIX protein, putative [Leishmania panamensis]AIN95908.1 MIX protein, putative [Leishmania panamensis]